MTCSSQQYTTETDSTLLAMPARKGQLPAAMGNTQPEKWGFDSVSKNTSENC